MCKIKNTLFILLSLIFSTLSANSWFYSFEEKYLDLRYKQYISKGYESFEVVKHHAEQGDGFYQCILGMYFQYGIKTDRNLVLSTRWYEQAAKCGEVEALFQLAAAEGKGRIRWGGLYDWLILFGIKSPPLSLEERFLLAAEKGHKVAQYSLGAAYQRIIPVVSYHLDLDFDDEKGRYWLKAAADQGVIEAESLLKAINEGRVTESSK